LLYANEAVIAKNVTETFTTGTSFPVFLGARHDRGLDECGGAGKTIIFRFYELQFSTKD